MAAPRVILLNVPKVQPIDIEFENIQYEVQVNRKESKMILSGIQGHFKSGELTGIMGPSGAGKSTLLNILSGFVRNGVTGNLMKKEVNSMNKKDKILFQQNTCYIQQDDFLFKYFSVFECMTLACHLKIGNSLSNKSKNILIYEILDSIGLSNTINTRCHKLSGGQRKRLSIALELIDNPPVILLDEPTTGLDSSTSLQVLQLLKGLAKGGRNIICTIHQPTAFMFLLFDQVYALANGECVYQGNSNNTISYLASIGLHCPQYHNPADYLLEVISGEYGDYHATLTSKSRSADNQWISKNTSIENKIEKSIEDKIDYKTDEENHMASVLVNPPSNLHRLPILSRRIHLILLRDWSLSYLKLMVQFFVATFVGLLFLNIGNNGTKTISNISYFFITTVYIAYTTIIPSVLSFPTEIQIIKKEIFNNWYDLKTYFIAHAITNLPIMIFNVFIFTSISYVMTAQPLEWPRYLLILLINSLNALISESVGLTFGSLFNAVNGVFFGSIFLAVTLLFSGFMIFLKHMHSMLRLFSFLFYTRYVFETQVIAIYGNHRNKLDCPDVYCHYADPEVMLRDLGLNEMPTNTTINICVLIMFVFIGKFVTYFALKHFLRQK